MAEHMKLHRKDYHSRRGLEAMLSQRRSLLQYLRRTDFDSYAIVLNRLGLKDNYKKLVRCILQLLAFHQLVKYGTGLPTLLLANVSKVTPLNQLCSPVACIAWSGIALQRCTLMHKQALEQTPRQVVHVSVPHHAHSQHDCS